MKSCFVCATRNFGRTLKPNLPFFFYSLQVVGVFFFCSFMHFGMDINFSEMIYQRNIIDFFNLGCNSPFAKFQNFFIRYIFKITKKFN